MSGTIAELIAWADKALDEHERTGREALLDEVRDRVDAVVAASASDDDEAAQLRCRLSQAFHLRFHRFGKEEDYAAAVTHAEAALGRAKGADARACAEFELGRALACPHRRQKAAEDLERAIRLTDAALAATPDDHPERP